MTVLVARLTPSFRRFSDGPWALPSPRRLLAMIGPGYLVAVGYIDPGNWATDLSAGTRYGAALLAVVVAASLAAAFFQALVVRLTLATGKGLARLIRDEFPRPVTLVLWGIAEIAMAATDLAELLGCAVALELLFGWPIPVGVAVTGVSSLAILALPRNGAWTTERVVVGLFLVVAVSLLAELVLLPPSAALLLDGLRASPVALSDPDARYLSLGILGATLMPHNLYLHSGLALSRARALPKADLARASRGLVADSTVALLLACVLNAAILLLAAVAFHRPGGPADVGIEGAYRLLDPALGAGLASLLFAVALLTAGQSATATGTMAGQMVAEGFLDLRLSPWLRAAVTRGLALGPALVLPMLMGEGGLDRLLILSQVVLGAALPFTLVPMLLLLGRRRLMRGLALGPLAFRLAGVATLALVMLDAGLVGQSL